MSRSFLLVYQLLLSKSGFELFKVCGLHIAQWETQQADVFAHEICGCLNGNRVDLDKQRVHKVKILRLKGPRPCKITLEARARDIRHHGGENISHH